MAGKKDIVEQALKLIAGSSDDAANRIASIRRSEPFPADYIEPGSVRYRYEHPDTSSFMEIITRPKGARSASVIGLEVPEEHRGTGIGKALQERVLQDYPSLMGQVSSKAAAVNAYKVGRRPLANPNATLEDVFKMIDEDSSVNLATPKNTGGRIAKGPGGWLDDVVRMAGKVISGEGEEAAKTGIKAYHASPHDFDKFEWSPRTSMTGEGAQSYGAGLYFAESPSVSGRGGTYDKQFTRKLQEIDRTGELGEKMGRVKIGGKPSTEYGIENDPGFIEAVKAGNVEKYARERLDRWHELSGDEKYPYRDYADEKMRAWQNLLNDYSSGADVYYPMKARIYETNIAADPEKMMRWDEQLKDQPVEVMRGLGVLNAEDIAALQAEKRAIESKLQGNGWNDPIETQNPDEFWSKVNASAAKNSDDYSRLLKIERELSRAGKDIPDVTSGKFYKSSSERPENISLELRDRGVPGIQFWDGNSRGKSYLSQWRTDPLGNWTTDAFPSKGEATEYLGDVLRSAPALKGDERFSRVIQNPKATSNYVVFDDKLISIIRKYGIAGASAMLGYNLMEQLDPKQALAASMADQDYQASRPQGSMGGNNSISGALNVARGLNGVK